MTHKVFVYGSLKKGFSNHGVLHGATFEGVSITTKPLWEMISLGAFPGVIRGDNRIQGEIYTVSDAGLQRLDNLEGNGRFYNREEIKSNKGVVWMYVLMNNHYNNNKNRIVENNGVEVWIDRKEYSDVV